MSYGQLCVNVLNGKVECLVDSSVSVCQLNASVRVLHATTITRRDAVPLRLMVGHRAQAVSLKARAECSADVQTESVFARGGL